MLKKISILLVMVMGLISPVYGAETCRNISEIDVSFSPKGGCTDAVVSEINSAKSSIKVQAYSFTSEPIINALIAAKKRNVDIIIILDKGQKSAVDSGLQAVKEVKIPTYLDTKHAIAHNKIMVIDGKLVIMGSFNFTKNAEYNNAENLAIIRDICIVDAYLINFENHRMHSILQ